MSQENLDESLAEIRQAAKEYYARKAGTWTPKRDLDAERLEDDARYRREGRMLYGGSLYDSLRMSRYSSGPEEMTILRRVDYESVERIMKSFADFNFSSFEDRIKTTLAKKMALASPPDMVILDELPTSSLVLPSIEEMKDYQHKFLYGEWVEPAASKLGAGKNPMADHTIKAVKKSHGKRRFSQKSK